MSQVLNSPIGIESTPVLTENGSRWPSWVVGSRGDRVLVLLLGVWLMNAFDLMLTILAGEQGILHEANPIAAQVVPHGPTAITWYKLALIIPPSIVLLRLRTHRMAEIAAAGIFLIYITVSVRWRMVYELYMVSNAAEYYALPHF